MNYKDITELTVYPSWLMNPYDRANNYAVMANGYQLAVDRLIDPLLEDNWPHDADELIYPILFCCHQCIELNLKAAIIALHDLSNGNPWTAEVAQIHNLEKLIHKYNHLNEDDTVVIKKSGRPKAIYDFIGICKKFGSDEEGSYYPDFGRFPESLPDEKKQKPLHRYSFSTGTGGLELSLIDLKKILDEACSVSSGVFWTHQEKVEHMRTVDPYEE
ncbi:hypothetical protein [Collinsella intestinalis]|uniref:hypothetical protein n=1 Tax=Collinsella intestinalis TaxID=147207 RepID=UPI0022E7B2DE|nr:hypothetical protein [Collinsella intestinalis]